MEIFEPFPRCSAAAAGSVAAGLAGVWVTIIKQREHFKTDISTCPEALRNWLSQIARSIQACINLYGKGEGADRT